MKGLTKIPSRKDLLKAYNLLQASGKSVPNIVLLSQWARFDPRLAEILVEWIANNWTRMNAVRLHYRLKGSPWPEAMGPILIFAGMVVRKTQPHRRIALFRLWQATIMYRIQPAQEEQFYIGIEVFAGKRMRRLPLESNPEFAKWGYLAFDAPINKFLQDKNGFENPQNQRQKILAELIASQPEVSVTDYIEKLNHSISRRQAERDLAACSQLRAVGYTRGRIYRLA